MGPVVVFGAGVDTSLPYDDDTCELSSCAVSDGIAPGEETKWDILDRRR